MASNHFFKIIVNRHLEAGKLMLPKKFINDYGSFLSSSIRLKLPNGSEWRVSLATASNGTVWLQNGWHEFSQHHGLKFGSLLVFRLDGNSTFHTLIFDMTGSEIQYLCNFNHSHDKFETEDVDDDDYDCLKKAPEEEEYIVSREKVSRRIKPEKNPSNNSKADSKTSGFKVVLKKSTVEGRFNMRIPKNFARKYMNEKFGTLKFQISDGSKSWPVVYKWSQSRKIDYAYISSGWKSFAKENYLKEGDILFFQMIRKDHFIFTIEESSLSPSPMKNYVAAASSLTSNNPYFKVIFGIKSYKNSVLNIPLTFAHIHLSPTMHTARLIVGRNKQWTVGMREYEQCFRFAAGWAKFYRENLLQYGDSCFFELVRKNKSCCVFKVYIIKKPSISAPTI